MNEINLKINGFDVAEIQRDLREIKNLFKKRFFIICIFSKDVLTHNAKHLFHDLELV